MGRGRARHCGQVCDTLDRCYRGIQIDTGRSKRTDVSGHLGEVIDGFVRILVELRQSIGNLIDSRALACGVGENSLNRVHLKLILRQTTRNGIDGERIHHSLSGINDRVGNIGDSRYASYLQRVKLQTNRIDGFLKSTHIDSFGSIAYRIQALSRTGKVQSALQAIDSRHRRIDVLLEVLIVECHLDYAFIYKFTHILVTSLHAFSTISSNTGWIAGFM